MRIQFMGLPNADEWRAAYIDVKDEDELEELRKVDMTTRTAPLEFRSRWVDNDELTGVMTNFCLTPNCEVCGGMHAIAVLSKTSTQAELEAATKDELITFINALKDEIIDLGYKAMGENL